MYSKRKRAELNAGSMADIAFLLLIFFLVTTTMNLDAGISRKLAPWQDEPRPTETQINGRNVLTVLVNKNNHLLVEGELVDLRDLRNLAKAFVNNNGDLSCAYCRGAASDPASSDNPQKAVVSLQNDRGTAYNTYVAVQNELTAAYNELRQELAKARYGIDYSDLNLEQSKVVMEAYPMLISEAEPVGL